MKLKCKRFKKIPLVASLAILFGCGTTPEPKPPLSVTQGDYTYVKEYMRWYIKEQMEDKDIVGLSIALVDDQEIVWQEGFGYADKANDIKATPQTRYRAGSITKLFNAMAVMKLVEDSKMNIDEPLKRYLPEFSIKSRFGSTNTITPRNIMSHHSGLPGDWLDRMFATNPLPYTEHVGLIKDEYVAYAPNTLLSYSNLGITLLGHAVEKTSGMKYEKYIDKMLLSPMEMKNSDLKMALLGENTSKAYSKMKEVKEYPIGEVPAGALNTTVGDLSRLAMMVNADGKYKNKQVLNAHTLKKMFTVQNENIALDLGHKIGLGWFIDTEVLPDNSPVYGHGGATIAHRAYMQVDPKSKLGVVVLSNSALANVDEIANKFLQKAWEAKMGVTISKPKEVVQEKSDFEGVYATMMGKVEIEKKSDGEYMAHTSDGDFTLTRDENNNYRAKYKLLGLIPISSDELEDVSFHTKNIDGKHLIIMNMHDKDMLAGLKVKRHEIPNTWKEYIGHYEVLNNVEMEEWKIKSVEFSIEDGYALVKTQYNSGQKMTTILKPINDTEAIVEGIGRSMQETLYMKDDVFHLQGLRFKRIKGKKK